jgi:SAM-dependent methyltransferase
MNYKLLFPTYRSRYLFVRDHLRAFAGQGLVFEEALNLGTGEGDYDGMIAGFCKNLTACDINEQDVAFAKQLNYAVTNVQYAVADALALPFPNAHFDLLISVDVLEHVGHPERMMEEVGRVLKPGGMALITFPSLDFPFTYDPINKVLGHFSNKKISQGAYAFGHKYLITSVDFQVWASQNCMEVLEERNLSGALVAGLEMYWTGIIQRLFKSNAYNVSATSKPKNMVMRPSPKEPKLIVLTDFCIKMDKFLFGKRKYAVGKGFILRKLN